LVIRYVLQQDAKLVTMTIYDLQGKQVATLLKKAIVGKTAESNWDASRVSGGFFICRISVDGRNQLSRRVIISR
jgi:hypothetical protein